MPIESTKNTSSIQSTAPQFGHDVKLVNANDILAYVTLALTNMGDQLNDYKEVVMKQQADAKEIREALVLARQLNANGEAFTDKDKPSQGENYNEMMTKLSHHLDDPNVKSAYDLMLSSYGPYTSKDTNVEIGKASENGKIYITNEQLYPKPISGIDNNPLSIDQGAATVAYTIEPAIGGQDGTMGKSEMDTLVSNINDALNGISSGNELMMMNLQNLMQVRNQISQFGSNNLKSLNDTQSALISNMK